MTFSGHAIPRIRECIIGYANRVIRLDFPDLSEDPQGDPIWVAIKNPRIVPPHELTPKQVTGIVDGVPEDAEAASNSVHEMMSKLIVGWHAYDASQPVILNAAGEDVTPAVLLPFEFTPGNVAKLPMEIINRIGQEMAAASNPR